MAGAIGLALSGGAVRGIAHIAVLDVLEREGIPVAAIAGTSAGSMVGALYAAGMAPAEIEMLARETAWKKIVRPTIPRMGFIASEGIFDFMNEVLPVKTFSSMRLPFAAVATDLRSGERVTLTSGSIARAVQASCSLPVVFTPTMVRRKTLVDGGVASMVPVRALREELGVKKVVAVNVNDKDGAPGRCDNLLKIAVQVSTLWAKSNAREEERLADVVIPVSAIGIALYDLTKTAELLKRGRAAAESSLPAIRRLLRR